MLQFVFAFVKIPNIESCHIFLNSSVELHGPPFWSFLKGVLEGTIISTSFSRYPSLIWAPGGGHCNSIKLELRVNLFTYLVFFIQSFH